MSTIHDRSVYFSNITVEILSFRRAAAVIELVQVLCVSRPSAMQLTIFFAPDTPNVHFTLTRYCMLDLNKVDLDVMYCVEITCI